MSSSRRGAVLCAAICALLCANASAAQFTVDKTSDDTGTGACDPGIDNDCSLRSAIKDANLDSAHDDIVLGATTYHVTSAMDPIEHTVTITGAGARSTAIDGGGVANPLLSTNVAEAIAVSDLTIRNAGGGSGLSYAVDAGLAAPLTLTRIAIVDNAVTGLFLNGGVVELVDSLVARNTGNGLGGLASSNSQTLLFIDNSTIAQNTALDFGAAARVAVTGGLSNIGGTVVVDSTIAGNRVAGNVFSVGGDNVISQHPADTSIGILRMANTIVADPGRNGNCGGDVQSAGHNLDSDNTCGFHATTDKPGVDPLLAALADNGGPTDTRALQQGSPAIDAGAVCAATDQRGVARPAGAGCDVGAFESPFTALVPTPPTTTSPTQTPPSTTTDTTPAKLTVTGVGRTVKRAKFNRGLKVKIGANEPISAELILLATPRKVSVAKLPVVALASLSLSKAGGTRTVTLKPSTKVKGKRKVKAQLRVVAFDGGGNRSAKTLSFTVT